MRRFILRTRLLWFAAIFLLRLVILVAALWVATGDVIQTAGGLVVFIALDCIFEGGAAWVRSEISRGNL